MSDIFVKFVDDDNPDNEVALGYKIECRENEKYYTTSIASVENYRLLLDKLPDNAAGTANREEITVTFRYKKVTDEDEPDSCRVNVIYMLDNGSVIETETLTGNEGEAYNVDQKEYEERKLVEVPGTERTLKCDLLLIAAGFIGAEKTVPDSFGLEMTGRGVVATPKDRYSTNIRGVFAAGDMRRGQSLVVWALAEGRACAAEVDEYLMMLVE